uniref:Uncharacterized protein n=1 Tax=Siphoviridae sp. ctnFo11 TaxID=2826454 RepID=A0A8S5N4U0_9CAUD|nr:MAG TPA: hypothetical protein [Siphoviridae sp. ctnFo11]
MPYQKIYSLIGYKNFPSEDTPLNETNMGAMDRAIDEIDNRIVAMDASKVDLTKANELVEEILWDESNGTLTVVKMNGSKAVIDTKLEKLAVNFKYDPQTQQLVITLDDGTAQNVDLSALITEYEFLDSDTIAFEIVDGKVKANVKNGSITEDKLQPNFLADIKVEVTKAETASKSSSKFADASNASSVESKKQADISKEYADKAKEYTDNLDKKAQLATFDVNEDGELVYTDNSRDIFTVDNDGNLNWEVA